MTRSRLEQQMQFILEIDKLKAVLRQNYLADNSRRENDAEHSWHLALLVMTLAEYFTGTDVLRVLKMVLIHDLVEIDAGDTFLYDEEANKSKAEREQAAAKRIFGLLPPDQEAELNRLWQEFEHRETPEAVFAAAVDRIAPLLLNIATEGRTWRQHQVTLEQVLERNVLTLNRTPVEIAGFIREQLADAASKRYFHEIDPSDLKAGNGCDQTGMITRRDQDGRCFSAIHLSVGIYAGIFRCA